MASGRGGRPWRRVRDLVLSSSSLCWLCGKPIDPQLRYPDPMSGEGDHVVPLASGGALLDPGNVRPAHRICNQRRGRRLIVRPGRPANITPSREW